ncbi:unnamed protein product [Staurois parvus]|uniref:Kazal-like domain-containing protein n=1 Tax=Staurois parvus TaxID=386267 RepID=A0ABN9BMI3_9NEOB|nr:unnamed protein product [Staurois parvus]
MNCFHRSTPLHELFPSECPLTCTDPIRVFSYMDCSHQGAPLHAVFPSECSLT